MSSGPAASAPQNFSNDRQVHLGRSVLVRAIIGVVLLFMIVSSGAWLLHAGIQAEAETTADEVAVSQPVDRTH